MSHEDLITRGQSIFIYFCKSTELEASASQPASTGQHRPSEARLCLDLQKNQKCFVFWLSGPHGTSNFDHQSLIRSDLNYSTVEARDVTFNQIIES